MKLIESEAQRVIDELGKRSLAPSVTFDRETGIVRKDGKEFLLFKKHLSGDDDWTVVITDKSPDKRLKWSSENVLVGEFDLLMQILICVLESSIGLY